MWHSLASNVETPVSTALFVSHTLEITLWFLSPFSTAKFQCKFLMDFSLLGNWTFVSSIFLRRRETLNLFPFLSYHRADNVKVKLLSLWWHCQHESGILVTEHLRGFLHTLPHWLVTDSVVRLASPQTRSPSCGNWWTTCWWPGRGCTELARLSPLTVSHVLGTFTTPPTCSPADPWLMSAPISRPEMYHSQGTDQCLR